MTLTFDLILGVFSSGLTVGAAAVAIGGGLDSTVIFLSILGVVAGWLRFNLAPAGRIALSPIVFFVALLVVEPRAAFVVGAVSAAASAVAFHGQTWKNLLKVIGEDGLSSLISVLTFSSARSLTPLLPEIPGDLLAFILAVASFAAIKLVLVLADARMAEGIGLKSFLPSAGREIVANLLLFGLIALGVRVSLYEQFGYLALILVTIALVEFYHPWKLLSEQDEILFANLAMIAQAIDIKDPYTARHSRNVARIATLIARALHLPEVDVRRIRIGALMHDIGKIGVGASVIRKPGKLEQQETTAMRQHPSISADIMRPIELLSEAAEIVRHHHEYLDGTGYPDGLRGEDVPFGSRVILVADAFDAMTTDRPYRPGRSKAEAIRILREHSGRQFDGRVVQALESVAHLL